MSSDLSFDHHKSHEKAFCMTKYYHQAQQRVTERSPGWNGKKLVNIIDLVVFLLALISKYEYIGQRNGK